MLYYLCFSEQQKINSGFFLFEAEQKAKKKAKQTKKNITEKCNTLQPKQFETKVNKPHILSAHSSDESSFTDESIN